MTELELTVEALKLCIDPVVFARALETVTERSRYEPLNYDERKKTRVNAVLIRMGVPMHSKGFEYTATAIVLMLEHPEKAAAGFTKWLYPEVARIHGVDWHCVERAIRAAVNYVSESSNTKALTEVLGLAAEGKMTSARFLNGVKRYILDN